MKYFPIFLKLDGKTVVVSGAGQTAVNKLRLLLKTQATILVFGENPVSDIRRWHDQGRLSLIPRTLLSDDVDEAILFYGANDDAKLDAHASEAVAHTGAIINIVDNLEDSAFITPAIVDRDPVMIAIGTEGTAPVVARQVKADIEDMLPQSLGVLARLAQGLRAKAEQLPTGLARRKFWSDFFFNYGPKALEDGGEDGALSTLSTLIDEYNVDTSDTGIVSLVGAGPGDPDLLTGKARKLLHEADVVLHDALVSTEVLELARREALVIETGKRGFGASWSQEDINDLMVKHARKGANVVRLKSGDPVIYGRLTEELDALAQAGITTQVVPGITAASAAAANLGASLTERGRNSSFRFITGHDVAGFADQNWRDLALTGATAAIYMGKKSSAFLRGRLLMNGANADTPVCIVENVSRVYQRTFQTTLLDMPETLSKNKIEGPAVMLYGIKARNAASALSMLSQKELA